MNRISFRASFLRGSVAAALAALCIAAVSPAQAWEMRVCADPSVPPFSRQADQSGLENRIARIIADHLGAELTFVWFPQGEEMTRRHFRVGNCDVVMGVQDGQEGYLTTFSYYRSPFVFVYRADAGYDIATFDDPILRELRLGVQPQGGPVHEALMTRGLGNNILAQFANTYGTNPDPLGAPFLALANGEIDVMLMWGGGAGYLAAQAAIPLKVVAVPPFEPPFIPMFINVAMGVRPGDESFRDLLDIAIAETWDEIYAVLNEFHMPLMELPRPTLTIDAPVR